MKQDVFELPPVILDPPPHPKKENFPYCERNLSLAYVESCLCQKKQNLHMLAVTVRASAVNDTVI